MSSEFRPFSEYKLCEYRRFGTFGQWFEVERDRVISEFQEALKKESDKVERWQDLHADRVRELSATREAIISALRDSNICDFEELPASELNYLQCLRKLIQEKHELKLRLSRIYDVEPESGYQPIGSDSVKNPPRSE